jgi:hypothetical protein
MNKLHDPSLDTGLYANNYCLDVIGCQGLPLTFGPASALLLDSYVDFSADNNGVDAEGLTGFGSTTDD